MVTVRNRCAGFLQLTLTRLLNCSRKYTRDKYNNINLLISSTSPVSFKEQEKEGVCNLPGKAKTDSLTIIKSVHEKEEQERKILCEGVYIVVSKSRREKRERERGMREGSRPQETGEQTNVIQHQKTIAGGWGTRTPLPLYFIHWGNHGRVGAAAAAATTRRAEAAMMDVCGRKGKERLIAIFVHISAPKHTHLTRLS